MMNTLNRAILDRASFSSNSGLDFNIDNAMRYNAASNSIFINLRQFTHLNANIETLLESIKMKLMASSIVKKNALAILDSKSGTLLTESGLPRDPYISAETKSILSNADSVISGSTIRSDAAAPATMSRFLAEAEETGNRQIDALKKVVDKAADIAAKPTEKHNQLPPMDFKLSKPVPKIGTGYLSNACGICGDGRSLKMRTFICGHKFHPACLNQETKCPICGDYIRTTPMVSDQLYRETPILESDFLEKLSKKRKENNSIGKYFQSPFSELTADQFMDITDKKYKTEKRIYNLVKNRYVSINVIDQIHKQILADYPRSRYNQRLTEFYLQHFYNRLVEFSMPTAQMNQIGQYNYNEYIARTRLTMENEIRNQALIPKSVKAREILMSKMGDLYSDSKYQKGFNSLTKQSQYEFEMLIDNVKTNAKPDIMKKFLPNFFDFSQIMCKDLKEIEFNQKVVNSAGNYIDILKTFPINDEPVPYSSMETAAKKTKPNENVLIPTTTGASTAIENLGVTATTTATGSNQRPKLVDDDTATNKTINDMGGNKDVDTVTPPVIEPSAPPITPTADRKRVIENTEAYMYRNKIETSFQILQDEQQQLMGDYNISVPMLQMGEEEFNMHENVLIRKAEDALDESEAYYRKNRKIAFKRIVELAKQLGELRAEYDAVDKMSDEDIKANMEYHRELHESRVIDGKVAEMKKKMKTTETMDVEDTDFGTTTTTTITDPSAMGPSTTSTEILPTSSTIREIEAPPERKKEQTKKTKTAPSEAVTPDEPTSTTEPSTSTSTVTAESTEPEHTTASGIEDHHINHLHHMKKVHHHHNEFHKIVAKGFENMHHSHIDTLRHHVNQMQRNLHSHIRTQYNKPLNLHKDIDKVVGHHVHRHLNEVKQTHQNHLAKGILQMHRKKSAIKKMTSCQNNCKCHSCDQDDGNLMSNGKEHYCQTCHAKGFNKKTRQHINKKQFTPLDLHNSTNGEEYRMKKTGNIIEAENEPTEEHEKLAKTPHMFETFMESNSYNISTEEAYRIIDRFENSMFDSPEQYNYSKETALKYLAVLIGFLEHHTNDELTQSNDEHIEDAICNLGAIVLDGKKQPINDGQKLIFKNFKTFNSTINYIKNPNVLYKIIQLFSHNV
jgi:hypothetical protein